MNEKGSLAGFLVSKVGIAFVVFSMIAATTITYKSFNREFRRVELESVAERVARNIREVDSLPGKVRLERNLPSIKRPYDIVISGSYENYQKIEIRIQSYENVSYAFFLESKVNGGEVEVRRESPSKIILRKTNQIHLEVV